MELQAKMTGKVIGPSDAGYDQARAVFYGGVDSHPAVIVRVANVADVQRVVALARETGLPLAIRSGGHSVAAHSTADGGIVLDLGEMRALSFDLQNQTAWVEPGLTAGEYTKAADELNLVTGFGDTGSVGLGGLVLGGGVGYLSRKYGLTIDDLLAAEIVTADGEFHRVDANTEPDLFWALRGGGGNFGVVTRLQLRLHPMGEIYGGMLFLPATPETIEGFVAAAQAAPDELSTIANVMVAPPFLPEELRGKLLIMGMLVYAGPPEEGERAAAPFRALATPYMDLVKPMRYPEVYPPDDASYHPIANARTFYMDTFDRRAAEAIVAALPAAKSMMAVTQIRVLGGEVARVPEGATAYAHRQRAIMVNVAGLVPTAADLAEKTAWVPQLVAELTRGQTPGAYVNFLSNEGAARVREAYPAATWAKLAAIKQRYDPTNLFRLNQNIAPAGA